MELSKFIEKFNKIEGNSYTFEEEVTLNNGVYVGYLEHDNVVKESISIYTGSGLTGTKVKNYFLSSPTLAPWKYQIKIYDNSITKAYISYETTGDQVEAEDINLLQNELTRTQQSINALPIADNTTIKLIDNKLVAVSLDGLNVSVATINFLQGLNSNIMELFNNLSNPMHMFGIFNTYALLIADTTATDGCTAIVRQDENNDNKQMTYLYVGTGEYNASNWNAVSENNISVRDFTINPIDLTTEVTGKLPQANLDMTDIITQTILDEILANYTPSGGSGTGDMTKEIYDSNNNGIVDYAELAQTVEGALESSPGEVYRHNPLTNKVEFCPLPIQNTKETKEPIVFDTLTKDVAAYIELGGEYTSNCVQVSEKLEDETNITATLESYTNNLVTYKTDNVICTEDGLKIKDEYTLDNNLNSDTNLCETKFKKSDFIELIGLTSEVNE